LRESRALAPESSSGLVADALRNALNNRLRLWSVFSGCADENSGGAPHPGILLVPVFRHGQRYFKDNPQEFENRLFVGPDQTDFARRANQLVFCQDACPAPFAKIFPYPLD
jgi:hypothetical protein